MRAAARRVHHDLRVAPREGVDVVARQLARAVALAGVHVQRAAAGLLHRRRDTMARLIEALRGRAVALTSAELLARSFHDPAERHARGAGSLARAADEACLQMPDGGRARRSDRLLSRVAAHHEVADELDAPAWRVRFLAEDAVRGAVVEAEPARDARSEILGADVTGGDGDVPRIRTMAVGTAGIAARLREAVPTERVIDDPATLLPYSYDASFWSLRQRRTPEAVVVPESTAEVMAIVRVADETGTPIVARGAGTGQTGGAIAAEGGVVISFARMRKIHEIDRRNLH